MVEYIPSSNNLTCYGPNKRNFVAEVFSSNAFKIRKPFLPLFEIQPPKKVIIASRSVGKTYSLSALALTLCYFKPGIRILYTVPSESQMREAVAKESIGDLISKSPALLSLLPTANDRRTVKFKKFSNGSYLHLSYQMVFREGMEETAKKIRGTHDDVVIFDEVQDLSEDFISTVLPVIAHSEIGLQYYAGTFKTPTHMSYRLFHNGSRIETVVICPRCNYENIPSRENIDFDRIDEGPICSKCKEVLTRQEIKENMRLVILNPKADYMSLRISSLFAYWLDWKQLAALKDTMNMEKFVSEIVGEPVNLSDVPLTEEHIRNICWEHPNSIKPLPEWLQDYIIVAGIDWQGEWTDTVLTVGGIKEGKLHIFGIKRYSGFEANSAKVHEYVLKDLKLWYPVLVLADWGMGYMRNKVLKQYFNVEDVMFEPRDWKYMNDKFIGNKPEVLEKLISDIKKKKIILPRYDTLIETKLPIELLNYGIKELRTRGEEYLTISKMDEDVKDDAAMSLLYCYIAYLVIMGQIAYPKSNLLGLGNYTTISEVTGEVIDKKYFDILNYDIVENTL
jgi:hypothetical protein